MRTYFLSLHGCRRIAVAIITGCLVLPAVSFANEIAGPRVALVIGNRDYAERPLANPVNDARAMRARLGALGFKVIYRENADQGAMEKAVDAFGQTMTKRSVGLFYFSGHGIQSENSNYLLPIDARIASKVDLKNRTLDVGTVLETMENVGNTLNIVILDACRDNPFRGFRGGADGLATISGPSGSLIAFATAPGRVASDGLGGNHGVYTKHLLAQLQQPGLTVEQLFKKVHIAVKAETHGEQEPRYNVSIEGDFCFAGCRVFQDRAENNHDAVPTVPLEQPPIRPPFKTSRFVTGTGDGYYSSRQICDGLIGVRSWWKS
jgi:uncharacterized caspase-like protein